ncbi:serine/threonine-protein kinase [Actinomadura syzygii]|uniref:Protein kinase n=1 Tax=Actinomadura syzygii TaxID=1427538 RepID=A0A5D0TYE1_9ACTN|nr:serine/threonine-protein kinase [Actinomadura syzygii]TYC10365.1 protein kinase [Actinomadura syzygii]
MTTYAAGPLEQDEPRVLGPYRLLGRLGRGGMGTVYLAAEPDGRRVAVKVVNRDLAGESAFLARFRREVTAARRVHRFCTAPVIDAALDQDPPYIVTEYIDGPNLETAVGDKGPLGGSDLEGLAVGVATALAAIHGAGIVHRDLKPANVLLSSTGPRVIDFGIARALDAADGPTRTGQFVGTPAYIAPEVLRGETVEQASDVFSWGCVVAYAGTGQPPFQGRTVAETFQRIGGEEPDLSGLDPRLREIVAAALHKDPRRRPSARRLLTRLVGQDDLEHTTETISLSWRGPEANGGAPAAGPSGARRATDVPRPRPAAEQPAAAAPVAPVPSTASASSSSAEGESTVVVDLPFPASWQGPRRWFSLLRGLLVVPHLVVMLAMYALLVVVMSLSWLVVPFTRRYPRVLYRLAVGCHRWSGRVIAYAFGLTGEVLPPFRTLPRARRTS